MFSQLSPEDRKGYILIIFAILIISIIGYMAFNAKNKNKYDSETLCPLELPYNTTVLIIDKSDRWSRKKSLKIEKLLKKTSNYLPKFDRLTIKVIEPNKFKRTEVHTYFDMCNPGNEANPFYENPRRILKKYTSLFAGPLNKIMKTLSRPEVCKSTPLLSVIAESLNDESESKKINLIIVSDLLENSSDFNFYKHQPKESEIIKHFSMPSGKLNTLHVEYILRHRDRKKIINALNLYNNLTITLGGRFSKSKIMSTQY